MPVVSQPETSGQDPLGIWRRIASWQRRELPRPRPTVDELIEEAELISSYAVRAGLLADDGFFGKLAAVKALSETDRTFTNSAVVELQAALAASRAIVPSTTVWALQDGWGPGKDRWRDKLKYLGFVMVAVALMLVASKFTLTYKGGESLFAEMTLLKERRPGLQFSRLERQLLNARGQLQGNVLSASAPTFSANSAEPLVLPTPSVPEPSADADRVEPGQVGRSRALDLQRDLIAQDASFQYVDDLTTLDKELRLVKDKSDAFLADADTQLGTLNWLVDAICSLGSSLGWRCRDTISKVNATPEQTGGETDEQTSGKIEKRYRPQYASFDVSSTQNFCQYLDDIEVVRSNGWKNSRFSRPNASRPVPSPFIVDVAYIFDDTLGINTLDLMRQNCQMNLKYYSQSIPNIIELQDRIASRLAAYSYLMLPALYGALGSLLYFMRRFLDPFLPNPTLLRMIHRVALGALAGMVLAWFWDGIFNSNKAFQTIGFGLFTLAFVFGFAIDVFFTLLDRFVSISKTAASKIGAPR